MTAAAAAVTREATSGEGSMKKGMPAVAAGRMVVEMAAVMTSLLRVVVVMLGTTKTVGRIAAIAWRCLWSC